MSSAPPKVSAWDRLLASSLADVFLLNPALSHQLLVNGCLEESREEFCIKLAADLGLSLEVVERAVAARPTAASATGMLADYAAEAAICPGTKDVLVAKLWSQSATWEYSREQLATPSTASLAKLLRMQLEDMAQKVRDLTGDDGLDATAQIEVFSAMGMQRKRKRASSTQRNAKSKKRTARRTRTS